MARRDGGVPFWMLRMSAGATLKLEAGLHFLGLVHFPQDQC